MTASSPAALSAETPVATPMLEATSVVKVFRAATARLSVLAGVDLTVAAG